MFIYMVGQMKTMGDMVNKYTGEGAFDAACPGPSCTGGLDPAHGIVPLAIITVLYTLFGGLPASIMTDQIQALAIILIVIVISIFVFAKVKFDQDVWAKEASIWTDRGFEMGCSLCLAVFGAEVFNLASWQRVFAAKDDRALRIGISVGAGMICFLTFLFGVVGLLLKAQMHTQGRSAAVPAFILFEVNTMESTSSAIRMFLFILAVCMITSCVDSFQIGITSVITRFTQKRNMSYKSSLLIGMALTVLINVPAVAFATHSAKDINDKFDGLAVRLTDLFSMADIVTITVVAPVFAGLGGFATKYGCMAGLASGMATIMLWGWFEFGTFIAGLEMITMMCFGDSSKTMEPQMDAQGAPYPACGFYSKRSPKIFTTILVVTFVVTFTVSWMERLLEKLDAIVASTQGKGEAVSEAAFEKVAKDEI
jgi:Na+/proline symporter